MLHFIFTSREKAKINIWKYKCMLLTGNLYICIQWTKILDLISCPLLKDRKLLSCGFWWQLNISFLLLLVHPTNSGRNQSPAALIIYLGILYQVCQSLQYCTRLFHITQMSSEKITLCWGVISCFAFIMLCVVLEYEEIVSSYYLMPLFAFSMDKGHTDALCMCNKLLGSKMEWVGFSGLLTEQLKSQWKMMIVLLY